VLKFLLTLANGTFLVAHATVHVEKLSAYFMTLAGIVVQQIFCGNAATDLLLPFAAFC